MECYWLGNGTFFKHLMKPAFGTQFNDDRNLLLFVYTVVPHVVMTDSVERGSPI